MKSGGFPRVNGFPWVKSRVIPSKRLPGTPMTTNHADFSSLVDLAWFQALQKNAKMKTCYQIHPWTPPGVSAWGEGRGLKKWGTPREDPLRGPPQADHTRRSPRAIPWGDSPTDFVFLCFLLGNCPVNHARSIRLEKRCILGPAWLAGS